MRLTHSSACLTRVVIDGTPEVELAELQQIRQRILSALRHSVQPADQAYLSDALVNLALRRLLQQSDGPQAAMLTRFLESGSRAQSSLVAPGSAQATDSTQATR